MARNPLFDMRFLKEGVPFEVNVKRPKPVSQGTNKYGNWYLWVLEGNNIPVKNQQSGKLERYDGEVVTFLTDDYNTKMLSLTNESEENVKISITKHTVDSDNSKSNTFIVEKASKGEVPNNAMPQHYMKFVEDMLLYKDKNIVNGTYDEFKTFAKSDTYNVSEDYIDKLWGIFQTKLEE